MTAEELRAAGRLVGRAAAGIAQLAEGLHLAVTRRAYRSVRLAGAPLEVVHGVIAHATHSAVSTALQLAGNVAGVALAVAAPSAVPLGASRIGGIAQAVLNGFVGDDLHVGGDALAVRMAVRREGRDVPVTVEALAAAFPDATPYVVVLVHGLFGDDTSWPRVLHDRARDQTGATPVPIRYSTGRPVADNGADLDVLLRALVAAWPVPVERIAVVGYSMGGLVARLACRIGADLDAPYVPLLSDFVSIGTPYRGARLALLVGATGRAARLVPEVAPWADLIDHSAGVRDLERGLEVAGIAGRLFGDLLVHPASALGCEHDSAEAIRGASHARLLSNPAVHDALVAWLGTPWPAPAGAAPPGENGEGATLG